MGFTEIILLAGIIMLIIAILGGGITGQVNIPVLPVNTRQAVGAFGSILIAIAFAFQLGWIETTNRVGAIGSPTVPPMPATYPPVNGDPTATPGIECFTNCWDFDDNARTMTWIGSVKGTKEIYQEGESVSKIQSGYTAIITTLVQGEIDACMLDINGQVIKEGCDGNTYTLLPGTYFIKSSSTSQPEIGGFRWCSEKCN